jgi:outer membrane lipoprotein
MVKRFFRAAVSLALLLMLSACAGGISKQARSQVTYAGPFSDVLGNPVEFKGETVIWGGRVIETQNRDGLTEIVVLQLPLDGKYRPADGDQSLGRFLIRSAQFIDPVIYPPGTLITVVGQLQGAENRLIGEMTYRYPVIDIVEIQKYDPRQKSAPRFHIGIGVGGRL